MCGFFFMLLFITSGALHKKKSLNNAGAEWFALIYIYTSRQRRAGTNLPHMSSEISGR